MRGERERSWPREILFFSFSFSSFSSLFSCRQPVHTTCEAAGSAFKLRLGDCAAWLQGGFKKGLGE
jgi:hypothetical protein